MAFGKNRNISRDTRSTLRGGQSSGQAATPATTDAPDAPFNFLDDLKERNKDSFLGKLFGFDQDTSGIGGTSVQGPGPAPFGEELNPIRDSIFTESFRDIFRKNEADKRNQTRALALGDQINEDFGGVDERLAALETGIATDRGVLQAEIDDVRKNARQAPALVQAEFSRLRELLTTAISSASTEFKQDRADALAQIFEGQASATAAATQGIQGNMRTQMSQVDALVAQGKITPAQGQQMKNQTRVGSSMQLGVVVGETQLAFNKLHADTSAAFTSIIGQVETAGIQVTGAFDTQAGAQFAATERQSNEILGKMTELQKIADSDMNNLFSAIEGQRLAAFNMKDALGLALLPAQDNPFIQFSNVYFNDLDIAENIMSLDFSELNFQTGQELLEESIAISEGQGNTNFAFELVKFLLSSGIG